MDVIESACCPRPPSQTRWGLLLRAPPAFVAFRLISGLANKASQITMYDIKSYYNQAKNVVLNVPEMEAKVREATNEDAW